MHDFRQAQEYQENLEKEAAIREKQESDQLWGDAQATFLMLMQSRILPFAGWALKEDLIEFDADISAEDYLTMLEVLRRCIMPFAGVAYDDYPRTRLIICRRKSF